MSISAIVETLEKLLVLHCTLLELSKEKTPVLVQNQGDQLNQIINKENKLIKQVDELNQQRVQAIGEYLLTRGYKPDPRVTVGDLIKMIFRVEEKIMLKDLHGKLMDKIMELQKVNELNRQLIEHSLAFIEYSINLLVDSPDHDVIYSNPNQQFQAPVRNAMFDTKA